MRWKTQNPNRVPATGEDFFAPEEDNDDDDDDDNAELQRLENKYVGAPRRSLQNLVRLRYVDSIFHKGFRVLSDDDFLMDRAI
jgi:hypothetical protein